MADVVVVVIAFVIVLVVVVVLVLGYWVCVAGPLRMWLVLCGSCACGCGWRCGCGGCCCGGSLQVVASSKWSVSCVFGMHHYFENMQEPKNKCKTRVLLC